MTGPWLPAEGRWMRADEVRPGDRLGREGDLVVGVQPATGCVRWVTQAKGTGEMDAVFQWASNPWWVVR